MGLLTEVKRRRAHGFLSMVSRSRERLGTQSEHTPVRQWRAIHLSSLQTVPVRQRDPTSKDRSLHTHAKWFGRTDQPHDPGVGDGNTLALRAEAGIMGRSIANGSMLDQSIASAQSASSTMVREETNLR